MTLLEVLLVLGLAGAILVFSLQFNQVLVGNRDAPNLRTDVNELLVGMANYYKANCNTSVLTNISTSPLVISNAALSPLLNPNWNNTTNPVVTGYVTQFDLIK